MDPLLHIKDLSLYTPDGQKLFSNLNLTLKPGELVHIKGKNGSGKSSFVKTILGFYKHFKGEISHLIENEKLSYLPQLANVQFLLPMTLKEVIHFKTNHTTQQILDLGLVDSESLKRPWNTASGGEKQKALLTRSFLQDSNLLILDEPFNHLDNSAKKIVSQEVAKALQKKIAVVLISHNECLIDCPHSHSVQLGGQ